MKRTGEKRLIRPVLMYGSECWVVKKLDEQKLAVFEKVLRRIYGPVKENEIWRRLHNRELHERFKDLPIVQFIQINRLRWAGHVQRMAADRIPKKNHELYADGKEKEGKTTYKMAGPGW